MAIKVVVSEKFPEMILYGCRFPVKSLMTTAEPYLLYQEAILLFVELSLLLTIT